MLCVSIHPEKIYKRDSGGEREIEREEEEGEDGDEEVGYFM